jgi:protein ImuB
VVLLDNEGKPIRLTGRGALTGTPVWVQSTSDATLIHHHIEAWAGPWLLDERWWSADRRPTSARVQLVTEAGTAMLVRLTHRGWQVEGTYD